MRLIDADALPRQTQIFEFNGKRMENEIVNAKSIDNAPTIDAVPVWHGRWIDRRYGGSKRCSECGYIWTDFGYPNYCPDCGARMDKDGDD